MVNTRAKGQRHELRARRLLEADGWEVFPLYQPKVAAQGPIDLVAFKEGIVKVVQTRSGSWHDLRATKAFAERHTQPWLKVEAWLFLDRQESPRVRVLMGTQEEPG